MNDLAQRTQEAFELYKANPPDEAAILALVQQGVDVVIQTDVEENTLLHKAAHRGHLEVCKLLLEQDADIEARDEWGFTPLHFASQNGHLDVCEWLVKNGADINTRNNEGYTPLHGVAWSGRVEVCEWLHKNGADIHARGTNGYTPLHVAAWQKRTETVELLFSHGANVWANNNHGETALVRDRTGLPKPHRNAWVKKLEALKGVDCGEMHTTQDLYHLASVMKPSNPHNVPPPKEFIRILFQQHLPHEKKFNAMYEEIFSQQRVKPLDLQSARKEAAKGRGVL